MNNNLMSSFEFIAALMSIIIGLGVTNLLAGAARAFYRRRENPLDEVHIVLTVATLLLLVLHWWVTFRWNTEVNWTFDKFLVLTAWTVALYLLTVFLYQPIWYVPFVGQYVLLAGGGLIASRRGYDRFFAWYQLITLLAWALVVRRFLVDDAMTP